MRTTQEWLEFYKSLEPLGYPNYEINAFGAVRNTLTGKYLNIIFRKYNREDVEQHYVTLTKPGGSIRVGEFVARLVAECFKDEEFPDEFPSPYFEAVKRYKYFDSIPKQDIRYLKDIGYSWYRDPEKTEYVVTKYGEIIDTTYRKQHERWSDRAGYHEIQLLGTDKTRVLQVSRVVADAFLTIKEDYIKEGWTRERLKVKFKNGDRSQPNADNLELVPPGYATERYPNISREEVRRWRNVRRSLSPLGFPNYSINVLGEIWSHKSNMQLVEKRASWDGDETSDGRRSYAYASLVVGPNQNTYMPVYRLVMETFHDLDLHQLPDTLEYKDDIARAKEFYAIPDEDKVKVASLDFPWYHEPRHGEIYVTRYGEAWNTRSKRKYVGYINEKGYHIIALPAKIEYYPSDMKTIGMHRLVAMAFCKPDQKFIDRGLTVHDLDVNHIDAVKTNNRWDNLEWCTYVENNEHAYQMGLTSKKYDDPVLIRHLYRLMVEDRIPIAELSRIYDIPTSSLHHIKSKDHRYVQDILDQK